MVVAGELKSRIDKICNDFLVRRDLEPARGDRATHIPAVHQTPGRSPDAPGEQIPAPRSLRRCIGGVIEHPALARVIGLGWLEIVDLIDLQEIVAFALYKAEFGGGPDRNNGEAAVLARASVNNGIAIIDERAATRAARRHGVEVHGTLWLIANGVKDGKLDRSAAVSIVDELAATDMKLPVDGAGFFAWAYIEGLLP